MLESTVCVFVPVCACLHVCEIVSADFPCVEDRFGLEAQGIVGDRAVSSTVVRKPVSQAFK